MKKLVLFILLIIIFVACGVKTNHKESNPFLSEYNTPFNVPPFDKINIEHFEPAMKLGMEQQLAEVDEIVNNPEEPTFENTIAALDYTGKLLNNVLYVYYNYTGVNNSPQLEEISKILAPKLSAHEDNINLNQNLFERVKKVYEKKEDLNLNSEQMKLLEDTYRSFVRSGAELSEEQKERFREINQKLATLSLQFSQNVLGEVNNFKLIIDKEEDLAGLPEPFRDAAAEVATAKGHEGKWMFTLHN